MTASLELSHKRPLNPGSNNSTSGQTGTGATSDEEEHLCSTHHTRDLVLFLSGFYNSLPSAWVSRAASGRGDVSPWEKSEPFVWWPVRTQSRKAHNSKLLSAIVVKRCSFGDAICMTSTPTHAALRFRTVLRRGRDGGDWLDSTTRRRDSGEWEWKSQQQPCSSSR
jgi:hypothetical protein